MKRFLLRLALGLALAAVALYPLYLIAGNWYLRSGDLERRLNRRPERLLIQVRSAWTSWPGVVHVRGFQIRNQTHTSQWWAAMDRGTFTIRLLDLYDREFIVDSLSGSGVSFRLARRIDNPRWVRKPRPEFEPSIPGLSNPPARPPEKIYPRPPKQQEKARRDPWRIALGQVDLDDVRELWIDEVRFAGKARVAGGFDMQIWRRLRIEPTRLRILSGSIALGAGPQARPILADARGQIDGEMSPYSPAEHHGWHSLQFLSGRAQVEGVVPSLAFLDEYLQRTRWLALEARDARVAADLRVRRGELLPASRLDARPKQLAARVLDYRAYGPGRVAWEVLPNGSGRLGLDFGSFQVIRSGYRQPHVRGRDLRIEALTEQPRLLGLALFSPRSFDIRMPLAEVPNLAFYNAYLPPASGLKLTGGSGRTSARFQAAAPDWVGHGSFRLDARGVSADVEGRRLQGDIVLRTQLQEADFQGRHFDISGTKLDLTRVRMAGVSGGGNWWARAHLDRAVLEPGSPVLLKARVESTLSDPRPIFAFVAPPERRGRLLNWVDRLLDVPGVGAVADVAVGTGGVSIDRMAIAGGPALIQGRLRIGGTGSRGILYASYGRWDVGLAMDGNQRDWKILKPKQWFANQMGTESRTPSR
ncbi:MAG TPA: hypothetical protein VH394_00370 [Thermoanaerobaculia bacterium]|jgi:hypothetical protein|nr:hypothetical protein [Thermoanaerobaculia bacterium]